MEGYSLTKKRSENIVITCSKCHSELGLLITINGIEFLQIGGVLLRQAHGVCAQCGREIHWSVPDRKFELLMQRTMDSEIH